MIKGIIQSIIIGISMCGTGAAFGAAPSGVKITGVKFAGTGCPAGSVSGRLARNGEAFSLHMHDFVAEVGPGIPFSAKRKNCMLSVDLHIPQGWSYSVAEVEYKGYVDVDYGVTATQTSSYYFQGEMLTSRLSTVMRGPRSGAYKIKDTLGIEALVWSPCGVKRALNINAQVQLASTSRNAYGLITLDRIRGEIEQVYGLRWQRCR